MPATIAKDGQRRTIKLARTKKTDLVEKVSPNMVRRIITAV